MNNTYDILNALPEIVYLSDAKTHEILYMNSSAEKFFGEERGKRLREALDCKLEIQLIEICGSFYYVRRREMITDGKKSFICAVDDVTDEENKKRSLEKRLEMEHFIVNCMVEMHKNKPMNELLCGLLEETGKFLEADRVYVLDYDGKVINNSYEWCREGVASQKERLQNRDAHIIDRWVKEFRKNGSMLLDDIEKIKKKYPEEYKELKYQNVKRVVAAPLEENGTLIGCIGIDNSPLEKTKDSEMFFSTLGYFISASIVKSKNEERLLELSRLDGLTGLYNRNKYIADIEELSSEPLCDSGIIYADLNGLKQINDSLGHNAGDEALKKVAEIIIKVFGFKFSYRVGGDEFVMICTDIKKKDFESKLYRLKELVAKTDYSISVGIQYASSPSNINDLVKKADEQMYLDKKMFYRRRGTSSRYRFRNDAFSEISTAEQLKKLIQDERFSIWLQPRFNADTEEMCGSEALIRFFDENGVIVSPADFIPEMEDNELVHLIDLYVFRHICKYLSEWKKKGKAIKPVSLNMSHRTLLMPSFMDNIMNIWYDCDIPKEMIIIEVSEDKENGGITDIVNILADLKKRGFQIAIDNFGSRYADLYLFADLKFDILKLDGDMVFKIQNDKKTHILTTSIAQICHSENIKIVAEGVESEKALDVLRSMGCDELQGYLFDKPMPWTDFEKKYL